MTEFVVAVQSCRLTQVLHTDCTSFLLLLLAQFGMSLAISSYRNIKDCSVRIRRLRSLVHAFGKNFLEKVAPLMFRGRVLNCVLHFLLCILLRLVQVNSCTYVCFPFRIRGRVFKASGWYPRSLHSFDLLRAANRISIRLVLHELPSSPLIDFDFCLAAPIHRLLQFKSDSPPSYLFRSLVHKLNYYTLNFTWG